MQLCFWNSQPSDIMIRMAAFTTYQHCHTFSCSKNGPQMLFHVISPSMYSNHSNREKWHVPKNSLYTDVLPFEVSYLYWYESTLYIWYFCEWLTTWLIWNFYFWIVFSHVIWFDIYHIVCISYVIYISGDISGLQTITSVNANRYMEKVQIFTVLEGFNCPIFGGKGFAEVTPKGGRVSSIFLLPSDVFWCPPYSMGLRYHHNFRGPLRLTNYNFHTHILYCITFYYDICHIEKYWNV